MFVAALLALTPILGRWMAAVFAEPGDAFFSCEAEKKARGLAPARKPQSGREYLAALLAFNAMGLLAVLVIQMTQAWLPLNPQKLPNVPFPLALNTAVSFVTNTNWQAYAGEVTMSYGTQMIALAVQNFLSAATGLAVAMAFIRGLVRRELATIGNFWCDVWRGTVFVLLPISLVLAVALMSQGVMQSFRPAAEAVTLEGARQAVPLGPAASQVAIKMLGTNGGGFFGQNSAHPLENPTPLSNFLQMLAMFAIPAGLTSTFGRMAGNRRQGRAIFGAMAGLFLIGFAVMWASEFSMEGKEVRFGVMNSALFGTVTTASSCGAVNMMHESASPLAGLVMMVNMMLGEVIFGGVGSGLYGILVYALLTVFIAGLMVGRTPEYLGKKIEAREVRWAVVAVLVPTGTVLVGTALGSGTAAGAASVASSGPHGFSEILYTFTSCVANNGSAFSGLNANTDFYNYATAAAMLLGRFAVIVPVLMIAQSLATKKSAPPSAGTFPTDSVTFTVLLVCVLLIVGALTFFPALSLGPLAEHFLIKAGRVF